MTQHSSCGSKGSTSLPTRLLDVNKEQDALDEINIRLVETKNQKGIYACLSHCWGKSGSKTRLQTTKSTIDRHKDGIPLSEFPKTFCDAIIFVRELGIQYIWIDSLCIVQDDQEDWRSEASQMCSVYENACITIAATGADNASRGLYASISPEYQGYKVDKINGADIYVRKVPPHAALMQFIRYRDNETFPLLDRAWVYQERMLSPRFLHFGSHELVWECLTTSCCPCGDNYQTGKGMSWQPKVLYTKSLRSSTAKNLDLGWRTILMEYSRLSLSFQSDRLPALSGLAKQWQTAKKCDYLAGLWKSSLVGDLQWQVETEHRKPKPQGWRAPSWSWVSVDSEVRFWRPPLLQLDDVGTIYDAKSIPKSSGNSIDATGELESGYLVISVMIAEAKVDFDGWNDEKLVVEGQELDQVFLPDYALASDIDEEYTEAVFVIKIGELNTLMTSKDDEGHPLYNEPSFILVLRCLDYEKQVYERIGSCRYWRRHNEDEHHRTFFGKCEERTITIV
jgi:hypothetical protein